MPAVPGSLDFERYLQTYRNADGIQLYNLIDNVVIDPTEIPEALFDFHHVTMADAWTTLSYKYYRTIDLWWLIVKCNLDLIDNPMDMAPAGTRLRIPKQSLVQTVINTLNSTSK
jgi:hypothetical protein